MTAHRGVRFRELVAHLTRNELRASHRFTLLGAAWPLARLLAQWGVLAWVFGKVVDLGIDDYPVFLLCGLMAWSWFGAGVSSATTAVVSRRHLVMQPDLPPLVLPAVAVAVAFADVLVALPLLLVIVGATSGLEWSALLLPVLLLVQFVLMCGLGWLTAAAAVYLRDVPNLVDVVLTLLFYLTPVFYDVDRISAGVRDTIELNPMTPLVDSWRSVLIDGRLPAAGGLVTVAAGSTALALTGWLVFRRLEPGFADEL
jgi:lipopolysaccharide transport system permease protein